MFIEFPYTNFHELNLDWILKMIKELNDKFDEAISAKIKFADPVQWDITKQYETLTLVINDNMAYLSMQPVPAGTPIDNTDYWQNVFDMSTLYDKIDDLEETLNEEIEELNEQLSEEIQTLDETTVKNNTTKKVLFLGDSYSTSNNRQLFHSFRNNVSIPSDNIVSEAVSGASFWDSSNSFLMQAQNFTGDKEGITDIIVVGGINDARLQFDDYSYAVPDVSSVTSAMDAFITYCHTNYPNAELHTAYIGGCLPSSTYYTTLHPAKSQEWAFWCWTIYARDHGFNVLETWNAIHTSKQNYSSDGLHPSNDIGLVELGRAIAHAYDKNSTTQNRPTAIANLTISGKTHGGNIGVFSRIKDNMAIMQIPDNYFQIENGEAISNADWSEIFTIDNINLFQIRPPVYITTSVALNGFTNASTPTIVPAEILIQDGKIYIKVFKIDNGSYLTFTAGSFATVTFYSIPNIIVPLWEVN